MKSVLTAGAVLKAAEIIATGEVISDIVDEMTERSGDVADMLETIDKSIPEVEND